MLYVTNLWGNEIKTALNYYLTPVRMDAILRNDCGEKGILALC